MPGARGVKRTASKASSTASAALPKNKKKRVVQLEIPTLSKRRGRVLTCGQGDVGQLGLGEDVMETTRFKHVTGLKDNIVEVVAGGMHTVALDSDGKVWTFGCNDEGALGREGEEGVPMCVSLPGRAVAVSAGDSHSAALLEDGRALAWGAFRDSHGSMGLLAGKPSPRPAPLPLPEPAAALASGQDHLALLSAGGAVYTLGCAEQGQLGRVAQRSASRAARPGVLPLLTPARVPLKFPVARLWAGYHATFALDATARRLYAWGLNNYNQLGISGERKRVALFAPTVCDAFSPAEWSQLAAGQHHSLALSADGEVLAVGRKEYGRLGLGADCPDAERPEPIPALAGRRCVSIAAGTCNSFAVTADGAILGWGMGSEGQLGTGASRDAATPAAADPRHLAAARPAAVAAGGQHTVLLAIPTKDSDDTEPDNKVTEEQTESVVAEAKSEASGKRGKRKPQTGPEQTSANSEAAVADVTEPATEPAAEDESSEQARNKRKNEPDEEHTQAKKQKVNGDDSKDTEMEVEETDKPDEPPVIEEALATKQDMEVDAITDAPLTAPDPPAAPPAPCAAAAPPGAAAAPPGAAPTPPAAPPATLSPETVNGGLSAA